MSGSNGGTSSLTHNGGQPGQRAIQQRIENPLSKLLLEGEFAPKDTIKVGVDTTQAPGEFSFT